jgi:hypothetical protein
MPLEIEAASLGISRRDLNVHTSELAAEVHLLSRLGWDCLVGKIVAMTEAGTVKPMCVVCSAQYDETPTVYRTRNAGQKQSDGKVQPQITKVVQIELQAAVVVMMNGNLFTFWTELPCRLGAVDRCTSEVLVSLLRREVHDLKWMNALRAHVDVQIDCGVCDRAASNLRTERILAATIGRWRLTVHCEVHMLSTVQQKTLTLLDHDLSGMISLSLVMQAVGSVEKLRRHLVRVIMGSLNVYPGAHRYSNEAAVSHRTGLFDVLFDDSASDRQRRIVLEFWLQGDLRSDRLEYYGPVPDRKAMAEAVALAILPGPIPVFQRHRWLNSTESIRQIARLMNIHNFGARVIPAWIAELSAPSGGKGRAAQEGGARIGAV